MTSWNNLLATDEYQLRPPRRKLMPRTRDLQNFLTKDAGLARLANFGQEMMKWLPGFEQMYCEGTAFADEGEGVALQNGKETTRVTDDWLKEFNEWGFTIDENDGSEWRQFTDDWKSKAGSSNADDQKMYRYYEEMKRLAKNGVVDNEVSLKAWEASHPGSSGLNDWRNNWVSGQRHKSGSFGPGSNEQANVSAGKNMGLSYKNLDFRVAAGEWNHLSRAKRPGTPDAVGAADANQAYFINGDEGLGLLSDWTGESWSFTRLTSWLNSTFGNKSFYDIVMSGAYNGLDATGKMMLTLAMKESSRRIWFMERQVFGPVDQTRNDKQMMTHIDAFVRAHKPYYNYHEISLFTNYFQLQHTVTNHMTAYWEGNKNAGLSLSQLDNMRFWDFSQAMGARQFNDYLGDYENYRMNDHTPSVDQDSDLASQNLFTWRYTYSGLTQEQYDNTDVDELSDAEKQDFLNRKKLYDKANAFIKSWFGNYYAREANQVNYGGDLGIGLAVSGIPVTIGTNDYVQDKEGKWVAIGYGEFGGPGGADFTEDIKWTPVNGAYVYNVHKYAAEQRTAAYGYDRKFADSVILIANNGSGGGATRLSPNDETVYWRSIVSSLYGVTMNTKQNEDYYHPAYSGMQFVGLNSTTATSGTAYTKNWVVHLLGQLYKSGNGMGLRLAGERAHVRKANEREYNQDKEDFTEKGNEIAANKKVEAANEARKAASRRADQKTAEKRQQEREATAKAADKRSNAERAERSRQLQKAPEKKPKKA
ncbi:MAG: cell envelope integrity protein TolA [Candidatus Margulisbacteria bacterium]|jgi:hypothetical protein|nr:cell envelope integrity protein TolA [Candidatus Margulisiibacteriota bacterium]